MPEMLYGDERGRDVLECRKCGATFPEGRATQDGWHYRCPECEEAEGIGDGLRKVRV
jgi:Zn finger protein HypA/HybF involved in hydrogenase expression